MILKTFNIKDAKEGKPIITRGGKKARIICYNAKGKFPIIALLQCKDLSQNICEIPYTFKKNGRESICDDGINDLFIIVE